MSESDIVYQCGKYWVSDSYDKNHYTVYVDKGCHSVSDSSYSHDNDGLSLAIARARYMGGRNNV